MLMYAFSWPALTTEKNLIEWVKNQKQEKRSLYELKSILNHYSYVKSGISLLK